jgi:glutathione S-transferase
MNTVEALMLQLYHNDMSACAQKVRVTLAGKGLDWGSHRLDLRAGDQQKPEYLKLNPRGVVPTLVDNGRVVRESTVIMEYLDDEYAEPRLRPTNSYGRAQMRLWTKRLDEGHHDIATATLSMGIAFRFHYLARGMATAFANRASLLMGFLAIIGTGVAERFPRLFCLPKLASNGPRGCCT